MTNLIVSNKLVRKYSRRSLSVYRQKRRRESKKAEKLFHREKSNNSHKKFFIAFYFFLRVYSNPNNYPKRRFPCALNTTSSLLFSLRRLLFSACRCHAPHGQRMMTISSSLSVKMRLKKIYPWRKYKTYTLGRSLYGAAPDG